MQSISVSSVFCSEIAETSKLVKISKSTVLIHKPAFNNMKYI